MMFHLFKRKESCKEVPIYAIANGTLADLEEVEDITFSEKLLGDGVAFQYEGDIIYAPCAGEVILVSATRHAIGIQAERSRVNGSLRFRDGKPARERLNAIGEGRRKGKEGNSDSEY